MKSSDIKKQIRQEPKRKKKELPTEFINKMAAYCVGEDIHMDTLYQLCKVKHIDQMLGNMYEEIVKDYKLHEPTLMRFRDLNEKRKINQLMESKGLKLMVPIY